jgi:flagellin-like protein
MKKGVTPILATVLLLVITLAAAGAAYVYFMTVQEGLMNQTNNGLFINFQVVSCTASSSSLTFQLRNLGDQINAGDWLAIVGEKSSVNNVRQIPKDSITTLMFNFNETLSSGTFSVTLNSPGGGEKTTSCTLE